MKSGEGASAKMGTFCSVGVGPGDPGLLTLEAARLLAAAEVLAYPAAAGRDSLALSIAEAHLPVCCERLPVELEMTGSEEAVAAAYDAAAAQPLPSICVAVAMSCTSAWEILCSTAVPFT